MMLVLPDNTTRPGRFIVGHGGLFVEDLDGTLYMPADLLYVVPDDAAQQEDARQAGYATHTPLTVFLDPETDRKG